MPEPEPMLEQEEFEFYVIEDDEVFPEIDDVFEETEE